MRFLVVCGLVLLGCSNAPVTEDASVSDAAKDVTADAAESCDGDITACCAISCDNDVGLTAWVCVNGVRTCPAGSYSDVECKKTHPCMQIFCALPVPPPQCLACDGGAAAAQSTCDADAAAYVCPPGTYSEFAPDASAVCVTDAGTD